MTASHVSDALGDLVSAAVRLSRDAGSERASSIEEPREYRWVFEQLRPGVLDLHLLEFPGMDCQRPDHEGKVLLSGSCSTQEFCPTLPRGLEDLERRRGIEGCQKEWVQHGFPANSFNDLRLAVESGKP